MAALRERYSCPRWLQMRDLVKAALAQTLLFSFLMIFTGELCQTCQHTAWEAHPALQGQVFMHTVLCFVNIFVKNK